MLPLTLRHALGVLFLASLPLAASALSQDEIKAQVESMLARVATLQAELDRLKAASATSSLQVTINLHAESLSNLPCLSVSRTLSIGSRGDDVRELQRFLIAAGVLAVGNMTGYFGTLTEAAVKKWQTARGISASGDSASTGFGIVGPKTRASILVSCSSTQSWKRTAELHTCPPPPSLPPASTCAGSMWQKGFDTSGCVTGFQCLLATTVSGTSTNVSAQPPSIRIVSPTSGIAVTGGNTLSISWQSTGASPRSTASLSLVDASGENLGVIAENVNPTGSYLWRVPEEESDCSAGESAFDCIQKLARCEGSTSICSIPPGDYAITATLSRLVSTTSPLFRVAGTVLSSLVKALIGVAGNVSSPTPVGTTSSAGGVCVHEAVSYPQGATLSVPCEAGHCPSSSGMAGFITGTCTLGEWCIPYTSHCSTSFATIDVSAYEGGGAAPIGSGYAVNCPAEGYRAYLSCPNGGCVSGWNICRGGTWIRDPSQDIQL